MPKSSKQSPNKGKGTPKLRGQIQLTALFSGRITETTNFYSSFHCSLQDALAFSDLSTYKPAITAHPAEHENAAASLSPVKLFFRHEAHIQHAAKQIHFWKAQTPFLIIGAVPTPNLVGKCTCVCMSEPGHVLLPEPKIPRANDPRIKYGTLYLRAEITTNTTEFEIMSEPFVNNESFGYCPVMHVRTRTGQDRYIQVGARSIRNVLENLRSGDASLTGIKFSIRKKNTDRMSGFEGFRIREFT